MAQEIDPLPAGYLDVRWKFRTWEARMVEETDAGGPKLAVNGRLHCDMCCDDVDYNLLLPGSLFDPTKPQLDVCRTRKWRELQ